MKPIARQGAPGGWPRWASRYVLAGICLALHVAGAARSQSGGATSDSRSRPSEIREVTGSGSSSTGTANSSGSRWSSRRPSSSNADTPTDGVQNNGNSSFEDQQLLPLLTKEKALVQQYGPDHPEVQSIRAQIDAIRSFMAPTAKTETPGSRPAPAHFDPPAIAKRKPFDKAGEPAALAVADKVETHSAGPKPALSSSSPTREPKPPFEAKKDAVAPAANSVKAETAKVQTLPATPAAKESEPVAVAALTVPASTVAPPLARPVSEPILRDAPPSGYGSAVVQFMTILAALVMILLVQIVALILVFRRYAGQLVPQVRVEVLNNPSATGPSDVLVHRIQLVSPVSEGRGRVTGKSDDLPELGPEHAEEVRSKDEAKRRQDEAVLRQIVADNLRMRQQIDSWDGLDENRE